MRVWTGTHKQWHRELGRTSDFDVVVIENERAMARPVLVDTDGALVTWCHREGGK